MQHIGKQAMRNPFSRLAIRLKRAKKPDRTVFRNALPDLFGDELQRLARRMPPPAMPLDEPEETPQPAAAPVEPPTKPKRTTKTKAKAKVEVLVEPVAAVTETVTSIESVAPAKPAEAIATPVPQPLDATADKKPDTFTPKPEPAAKGPNIFVRGAQRLGQGSRRWRGYIHKPQFPKIVLKPILATHALKSRPVTMTASLWLPIAVAVAFVATQVTLYTRPVAGVYANAVLLALCVGLALWRDRYRKLGITLALLPTVSMVLISLPKTTIFTQTAVYYGVLLVLGMIYRYLVGFETNDSTKAMSGKLGWRGYARWLPAMIIGGQVLGLLGYGLLRNNYLFSDTPAPFVAGSIIIFALAEEIVFRGLIQQQAGVAWGRWPAAAVSAAVYAAMTIGPGAPWPALFAAVLGCSLSAIYALKPNILLTLILNIACKLSFLGLLSAIS